MEVHGHYSVIANNKILIFAQGLLFQVPVTSALKMRFGKNLSINVNNTVMDLYGFTWQADNAFEIHHALSRHTDADNVETLWVRPAVGEGIHEAVITRFIHREHAVTLYPDGEENRRANSVYQDA